MTVGAVFEVSNLVGRVFHNLAREPTMLQLNILLLFTFNVISLCRMRCLKKVRSMLLCYTHGGAALVLFLQ